VDSQLIGKTVREDIYVPGNARSPVIKSGTKIDQEILEKLQAQKIDRIKISTSDLAGAYSLTNVKGKVKAVEELTAEQIEYLITRGEPFEVFFPTEEEGAQMILNTLRKDPKRTGNRL